MNKHTSKHVSVSLPGQPLIDYCMKQGYLTTKDQAVWLGAARGSIDAWRTGKTGIRSKDADRIACSIGVHPMFIWGELWFDEQYHPLEIVNGRTQQRNQHEEDI